MVDQDEYETARETGHRRLNLRDIRDSEPGMEETPREDRVGDKLRAARLKRGEDLAKVAESLRIRRAYLEALEDGRYAALPGRTYALGFVRSYGAYLGFDGASMADAYKQEFMPAEALREAAAEAGHGAAGSGDNFTFPEVVEEARLPRGSLIILFFLLAGAIYGGWYLSISADRMVSERVPAAQTRTAEEAATPETPILPEREQSFAGDRATASPLRSRPSEREAESLDTPQAAAPALSEESGNAAAETANEPAPASGEAENTQQLAALAPEAETAPSQPVVADPRAGRPDETASTEEGPESASELGQGRVLGDETASGRVIVRALKDAWMRIEDGNGTVLINETLKAGDVYRTPDLQGLVLVARDAGAFEILVDEQSVGYAGPSGLVLTGKSLNPADLR